MFFAIFATKTPQFELPAKGESFQPIMILPHSCYRDVEFLTNDGEEAHKTVFIHRQEAQNKAFDIMYNQLSKECFYHLVEFDNDFNGKILWYC